MIDGPGPAVSLAARDLTVSYGTVPALEGVTLDVPAGARVAVLGPNGSGKSTLFAAAVGLIAPRSGSISPTSRRVAYLPQHLHVEPTFPITVADAVAMGRWGELGWLRRPGPRDRALVDAAMEELEITDLAGRRLSECSGGQRQRALIAQAVAQDADLLLLDEPFTGVDRPTAATIRGLIRRWGARGRTVLVATHDLELSASDFDLVLALNRRVIAFGPAEDVVTDEVLRETFGGRLAAVGGAVLDPDEHHH